MFWTDFLKIRQPTKFGHIESRMNSSKSTLVNTNRQQIFPAYSRTLFSKKYTHAVTCTQKHKMLQSGVEIHDFILDCMLYHNMIHFSFLCFQYYYGIRFFRSSFLHFFLNLRFFYYSLYLLIKRDLSAENLRKIRARVHDHILFHFFFFVRTLMYLSVRKSKCATVQVECESARDVLESDMQKRTNLKFT